MSTNIELGNDLGLHMHLLLTSQTLRRDDDDGIKFGYDSRSDINNNMLDDVKIMLANIEYGIKKE